MKNGQLMQAEEYDAFIDRLIMESSDLRSVAIARIKKKRELKQKAVKYIIVLIALIFIWAIAGGGSFWPQWVALAFAISLIAKFVKIKFIKTDESSISEEEIEGELKLSNK